MPSITSANRLRLLALMLAALLLPAVLWGAVPPTATDSPPAPPAPPSLAGQLLIAPPEMRDPRFDRAVVLVVRHDRDGALGIVINMPVGEQPLAALLSAIGEPATDTNNISVLVFRGGPVQSDIALVLHSAEYRCPGTLAVDGRVSVTASAQILRDMAAKAGPQKSLFAFGYAGWGAGQLDNEMAHNVWFTAPSDPKLVFDEDRDKVWELALARRTRDL